MKRRLAYIGLGISVFATVVFLSASFVLSDLLLYRGHGAETWSQKEPSCNDWLRSVAYGDTRPNATRGKTLDFACDDAFKLPNRSEYATSALGMKIHYKVYQNLPKANAYASLAGAAPTSGRKTPYWLHVHGITGNYLHGARYHEAASRLGFQLVAMELSNHGLSDNNGRGGAYGCREHHDVTAVVQALLQSDSNRDLLITASSMGTMAVINAAQTLTSLPEANRIVALSLEDPIPSVRAIVTGSPQTPRVPEVLIRLGMNIAAKRAGYDFESCKPLDNVSKLQIPTLVQHTLKDDLVPVALTRDVFEALPKSMPSAYKLYPEGGHSTVWNGNPKEFEADLLEIWNAGLKYRSEQLLGKAH